MANWLTRALDGIMLAIMLAGFAFFISASFHCNAAQRSMIANSVAALAGKVCIEKDSVSVCLSKCQASLAHPSLTSSACSGPACPDASF